MFLHILNINAKTDFSVGSFHSDYEIVASDSLLKKNKTR